MIDDSMLRFMAARERLFRCIEDELNSSDGHHKSYEGALDISLSFPNIFDRNAAPKWVITWHCYVVPESGRHFSWTGRTFAEAVAVMEAAAEKICFPYEMDRFSRQFEDCVDEPGEGIGPDDTLIYGAGKHEEYPTTPPDGERDAD